MFNVHEIVRPSTWRTAGCLQFLYRPEIYPAIREDLAPPGPAEAPVRDVFKCCTKRARVRAACGVYFHEMGLLENWLPVRNPAALLIVLRTDWLNWSCAAVRVRRSCAPVAGEIWANF